MIIGLLFILLFLFGLAVIGVVGFLIIRFAYKATQSRPSTSLNREHENFKAKLSRKLPQLKPWSQYGLLYITFNERFSWVQGMVQRVQLSLLDENGDRIITAEKAQAGLKAQGHFMAMSTDWNFYCRYEGGRFRFYWDDEPWGIMEKNGDLVTPQEEVLGNALHRYAGGVDRNHDQRSIGGSLKGVSIDHRTAPFYYPITLHGREVATVRVAPRQWPSSENLSPEERSEKNSFASIVTPKDKLSAEEERWVMSIALLEAIYFNHPS